MATRLIRLIAFIAVLLMPFGMTAAPAMEAAPAASSHCGQQEDPADAPASMEDHCAACSALPTIDAPAADEAVRPGLPLRLIRMAPFRGIVPDTITPPPKLLPVD